MVNLGRRSRFLLAGSLACAFAVVAFAGPLAAGADPGVSSTIDNAVPPLDASPLSKDDAYAQEITDRTQPILQLLEEAYPDLYGSAQVKYADRVFIISAKGEKPPGEVQALIDAVPKDLVSVEWRATKFSQKELLEAMDALPDLEGVSLIGPAPDASSVRAYADRGVSTRSYPKVINGVPIEYVVQEEGQLELANDRVGGPSQILRGGTAIATTESSRCSSGPNVERIADSQPGVVIAAHCSAYDNWAYLQVFSPSQVQAHSVTYPHVYGNTDANNYTRRYDAAFAEGVRGSSWYPGSVWAHAWGATPTVRTVIGAYTPVIGEKVCLSGGSSGRLCSGEIQGFEYEWANRVWASTSNDGKVAGLVWVKSTTGDTVGGAGDSGSVVYRTSGTSDANVAGIFDVILTGDGTVACAGVQNRDCASSAFYVRWKRIADTLGLRLMKG